MKPGPYSRLCEDNCEDYKTDQTIGACDWSLYNSERTEIDEDILRVTSPWFKRNARTDYYWSLNK